MSPRVAISSVALLCALLPSAARGQDLVELGAGAAVRRVTQPCWYQAGAICSWWQPQGAFSFGGLDELSVATAFGRAPSGRVLAMVPGLTTGYAPLFGVSYPRVASVLYSDDMGATWSRAQWPDGYAHALAFAFDPGTGAAIAVGHGGGIWSSDDGGVRWSRRRSSSGVVYVWAWTRGRTVIVEDDDGALWVSRDRGFSLESMADRARVSEAGPEVRVVAGRREWVLRADGDLQRTR